MPKKSRRGRKKINIELENLRKLRDRGLSNVEISDIYGCSVGTIANRTREFRLDGDLTARKSGGAHVKHLPKEDLTELSNFMTQSEMAKRFGVCVATIKRRMEEYGLPHEIQPLADRIRSDVTALSFNNTPEQIADLLNVSENAVRACCRKHSIRCKKNASTIVNKNEARRNAIVALVGQCNWSKTEVSYAFGISRERVRQIISRDHMKESSDIDHNSEDE